MCKYIKSKEKFEHENILAFVNQLFILIVFRGNKIVYIKNYESLAENNIDSNISSNMMQEIRILKKEKNHEFVDLRNEMIPIFENDKQNYKGQVFCQYG